MKKFRRVILFLVAVLTVISLAGCGKPATAEQTVFPKFQGADLAGNAVDESIFSKNVVTVLNLWSNSCTSCVDEMPTLEKLNQQLRQKGAELVGMNLGNASKEETVKEAKEILKKQGVTYRNIMITGGEEIKDYLGKVKCVPTTILVDRKGNVIGEHMLGNIDGEDRIAEIMKTVDGAIAKEKGK